MMHSHLSSPFFHFVLFSLLIPFSLFFFAYFHIISLSLQSLLSSLLISSYLSFPVLLSLFCSFPSSTLFLVFLIFLLPSSFPLPLLFFFLSSFFSLYSLFPIHVYSLIAFPPFGQFLPFFFSPLLGTVFHPIFSSSTL